MYNYSLFKYPKSKIMKKTTALHLLFLLTSLNLFAQSPVEVADNTIKIGAFGEQILYYGFAEGDQLVFNFQEMNGKELKEVEIIEMPGSSKFMDYKSKKIQNKTITINHTGIYKFRFSNSAIGGRVCKINIQRIPGSQETAKFNSSVYWKTVYDTIITPKEELYIASSDTSIETITDQIAKVSSTSALNGNTNKTVVDFTLPQGTVSWSYYIGVGIEGQEAYQKGQSEFIKTAAYKASSVPGYGIMGALALFGFNAFQKAQGGDNVKYRFISNWENVLAFMKDQTYYQYKQGDVINDASKMTAPLVGKVYLGLYNDNVMDAIQVNIKVNAVVVKNQIAKRIVDDMKINQSQVAYLKN
ncbi:hypothetical protein WG954_03880 [Lacibacter sp. H375]|uniref:hypothetical protein n=1 Tax=Lacibacter sp. H375 TaxID=3133424 RepID=UPI0030BB7C08